MIGHNSETCDGMLLDVDISKYDHAMTRPFTN